MKDIHFLRIFVPNNLPITKNLINLLPSYEELKSFSNSIAKIYLEFRNKLGINLTLPPDMLPADFKEKLRYLNSIYDMPCGHASRAIYIRANGNIVPCSIWNDEMFGIFGNIRNTNMETAWGSILEFRIRIKDFIRTKCNTCKLFHEKLCGYWNICVVCGCWYGCWSIGEF